ncbi:MAG TPA: hypothetical protein VFX70_03015, partial [Mycobacteriales bacterium]|nr:hypothetical protein [Mycobacteriales bacterium]
MAAAAPPPAPVSGDPRADARDGNATTCADVGLPADTLLGSSDSSGSSQSGFVVTSDGSLLNVVTVPAGTQIDAVVVKGGSAYNVYASPVPDMHAPLVGNPPSNIPTISHWFLCYRPATPVPPTVTNPSAVPTGDCDGVDFALAAGTSATTFVVTRAGDLGGQSYPLAAGQAQTAHVDLDATHPAATVTIGGATVATFSRPATCTVTNPGPPPVNPGPPPVNPGPPPVTPGGGNGDGSAPMTHPAASASTSCADGITLTLTNPDATAPVTFGLVSPRGSVTQVAVPADATVTRSFPVAE